MFNKKQEVYINEQKKRTRLFWIVIRCNPYCMYGGIMAYMDTNKVFKK